MHKVLKAAVKSGVKMVCHSLEAGPNWFLANRDAYMGTVMPAHAYNQYRHLRGGSYNGTVNFDAYSTPFQSSECNDVLISEKYRESVAQLEQQAVVAPASPVDPPKLQSKLLTVVKEIDTEQTLEDIQPRFGFTTSDTYVPFVELRLTIDGLPIPDRYNE